jgi:hypothetical protein
MRRGDDLVRLEDVVWLWTRTIGVPIYDFGFDRLFACRRGPLPASEVEVVAHIGAFDVAQQIDGAWIVIELDNFGVSSMIVCMAMFRCASALLASSLLACATQPNRSHSAVREDADPGLPPSEAEAGPDGQVVLDANGQPIKAIVVMANAIYAPDPDQEALANTKAARFDRKNGTSVIGFCVDTHGNTTEVHVLQAFPDDPAIDDILMDTIATWRFTPFTLDGQAIKTCTSRTFNLNFSPRKKRQ